MTTAQQSEIKGTIRGFISKAVHVPNLADDDNLFESGIVNSLFAVQFLGQGHAAKFDECLSSRFFRRHSGA